jgi:hypothetical protein
MVVIQFIVGLLVLTAAIGSLWGIGRLAVRLMPDSLADLDTFMIIAVGFIIVAMLNLIALTSWSIGSGIVR